MLDSLFLLTKVQHHKASMTKVQIPKRSEWQLKLQSASQTVRHWDKEGWFLRIYSPEFVQNSRLLAGDERVLDAINKYYCIPVQRRSCVRSVSLFVHARPWHSVRTSVISSGIAYSLLYKRLWFDALPCAAKNLACSIQKLRFCSQREAKMKQTTTTPTGDK